MPHALAPVFDRRFSVPLRGVGVDAHTRCAHYHGPRDIVAIRFPCCGIYYPCYRCHAAVAGHDGARWPRHRWDEPAVLCGACGATITAAAYLRTGPACPHCDAAFNPGCAGHHDRYFAVDYPQPAHSSRVANRKMK